MNTAKNESNNLNVEQELAAAKERIKEAEKAADDAQKAKAAAERASEEADNKAKTAEREAMKLKAKVGDVSDAAAKVAGSRVARFFTNMNRGLLATGAMAVGAAIGVGGTVMVQNRRNRTVVGTTEEHPMLEVHPENM